MKPLQPVLWTKGTLLSPQYLQAQDRFLESSIRFRHESLSYCPWGFLELGVDRTALAGGMFNVASASGIFPDGLPFDMPATDVLPPAKPLDDHFGAGIDSLDIYLAVPHYRDMGANVSVPGSNAETRYIAEFALMRDEVSGSSEKPVQIARKGIRWLVEGENRQGFTTLRAGRIRRTPANSYALDERFVPPILDVSASDSVMSIARSLIEMLAARSSELSGLRRQKNQSLADFTAADIAGFWLLYTINSFYPVIRHLFEVRRGHPEKLFTCLLELCGALTTFSSDIHPRDLPTYDHDNLQLCFAALDAKLRQLLDVVVPRNFISLELKLVNPSIYAAALAEDRFVQPAARLYLAVRADMDRGDLINKTRQLIKVGSASQIDDLVRRALTGIELSHVTRPPSALPVKMDCEYFSLSQAGPVWDGVVRSRNLAAYVPADFPSPGLELLILLPEAKG